MFVIGRHPTLENGRFLRLWGNSPVPFIRVFTFSPLTPGDWALRPLVILVAVYLGSSYQLCFYVAC